ncbi:MAG: CHAT domain-containing protein [Chloroflexi bacterium]|nr:CHAT domain-containing protein [Chloroflexota bacterium]
MNFLDLDLKIELRGPNGYPVAADSSLGQARGLCPLDPASPELAKAIEAIAGEELIGRGLAEFGQQLGDALINGEVRELFNSLVGAAQAQTKTGTKTGVRLQLRLVPDELNVLPWELARLSADEDPLSISSQNAITRYLEMKVPERDLTTAKPLRMLGIIPQGSGLNVDKEKEALDTAVAGLGESLQLTWLEGAVTTDRVRDALGEADYHIIHFIGHGNFKNDIASLQMNDEYGDEYPVRAETFSGFFRNRESVRLVVLNACRGAARSSAKALAGVAPQVAKKGVPAVLAMQWDFNDRMATQFGKAFYRSLCIGPEAGEVDTAVARGRGILYDEYPDSRGFATPVLFFRSDTGRLWKDAEAEAEEKKQAEAKATPQVVHNVTNISEGGVTITGNISGFQGDITGGKKITTGDNSNLVMAGDNANVNIGKADPLAATNLLTELINWKVQMNLKTGALGLSAGDNKDLQNQIAKVYEEAAKGQKADPGRLEKLINMLGVIAPDMFDEAVTKLAEKISGAGLTLTKVGDKAKVERG